MLTMACLKKGDDTQDGESTDSDTSLSRSGKISPAKEYGQKTEETFTLRQERTQGPGLLITPS